MHNIKKEHYNIHGNISNKSYEELDNYDKVMAYMKNWDKTHSYKGCFRFGEVRARFVTNFLNKILDISTYGIKMPEQMELVYQNFDLFKAFLNHIYAEGKIDKFN